MGSFGSLQGKKCSKTWFFRIFFIEKGKARQTPNFQTDKKNLKGKGHGKIKIVQ